MVKLLKLGFEIAESTVRKYVMRHRGPPSQSWRIFLRNHADAIAAIDLCVVPTVNFERLFAFLVLGHLDLLGFGKDSPSLLQRHRAPRGVLVPGADGQVLHLSVAQGLHDGLRPLQVGDERDARVNRPTADVVSIGAAELVVLDWGC
jgi:hypothetical protein